MSKAIEQLRGLEKKWRLARTSMPSADMGSCADELVPIVRELEEEMGTLLDLRRICETSNDLQHDIPRAIDATRQSPSSPPLRFKPGMTVAKAHGRSRDYTLISLWYTYGSGVEAWSVAEGLGTRGFYPDDRIIEGPPSREWKPGPKEAD
jgi:hypothetical protein